MKSKGLDYFKVKKINKNFYLSSCILLYVNVYEKESYFLYLEVPLHVKSLFSKS
ncbi:hypothetical protein BCAH1134_C0453 (plasmid) [Bacillus cereus AH1134]|nr:hypothetical protein BCAH1134_C0453 [Bacillus cereus AH1134]